MEQLVTDCGWFVFGKAALTMNFTICVKFPLPNGRGSAA